MFSTYILAIPMVLVLLSLAFMPIIAPKLWRQVEIYFFIIISVLSIIADFTYIPTANKILSHSILHEYIPFIIMLFTLYTLSNGIHITVHSNPTTIANIIFLATGGVISSFIGTTGAAMLLIRPFIEFNQSRKVKQHLIIFFIIIVANIGGLLTPLGDPPLLLGYLHGVEFTWLLKHMFIYWFFYILLCLLIFYIVDKLILYKDQFTDESSYNISRIFKYLFILSNKRVENNKQTSGIKIKGVLNIVLILLTAIILFVNLDLSVNIFNINVSSIYIKDSILLLFSGISIKLRPKQSEKLDFTPFLEVVRTFLVIFIVLAPVLYLMEHNTDSIHKFLYSLGNEDKNISTAYFSLCALASSFLDNAPSYLLFFKMTGCTVQNLMTQNSPILVAISVSSVVMGSLTYIGNAPNMMVKNIATRNNIVMPSFIAYCGYACMIVLPISWLLMHILKFR